MAPYRRREAMSHALRWTTWKPNSAHSANLSDAMPGHVCGLRQKRIDGIAADVIERLLPKIRELAGNQRPAGCKKLHGYKNRWRIRAGNYRVVYAIDDTGKSVDITRIAHRKEVYE